ncbi:hypothetical protein HMPREF0293_0294 [Corynebacterium glucuronolyticum ATCC 51866]|uniref:Uncharacterized protein n=1 Tax=Corynebacterium glucuronolyticum ATCC 51866 TaxID=548478 RepID=A0ABM9XSQ3_9CORY|nr:hypothetical protein HMPREF0293_0294 [Corynebacterium glucuronolyticum ATCC 51866]
MGAVAVTLNERLLPKEQRPNTKATTANTNAPLNERLLPKEQRRGLFMATPSFGLIVPQ